MNTHWENGPHYVSITPYEVVVGSNPGGTGHTDNAGSCSHKDFLSGTYQDLVREQMGEAILAEVVAAVKAVAQEGSTADPQITEARERDVQQLAAWENIPVNEKLKALADAADENGYKDNYGYGPGGTTVVALGDGVTLSLGSMNNDAAFTFANGSKKKVNIPCGPAVAHNGYAVVVRNDIRVFNAKGEMIFCSGESDKGMNASHGLGANYRVPNVLLSGDTFIVEYRNLSAQENPASKKIIGERGYLEVDPLRGVISRCTAQ